MKKFIISIIFSIVWMSNIMAQIATDALLLSRYYSMSTARSAGMSGAFGALGGDLSVLSTNPAGLAIYRGSEFTFTPVLNFTNTSSLFDNTNFKEKKSAVNFNNIGYVFTWNLFNPKGWQSVTLGLAYNRLSDFSSDAYIDVNANSSMLDEFVKYSNGYTPGQLNSWQSGLAYDCYAINDYSDNNTRYYSDYDYYGYGQQMIRSAGCRGGVNEYDLSIGANFDHKWYFGATWGIQYTRYEEFYTHEEYPYFQDASYSGALLQSFRYNSQYLMNGWGMNAKFGVIFRPINPLRFGLSVHTPTYHWMRCEWTTDMIASFDRAPASDETKNVSYESPISENKFKVTTPWRYTASAATVLGGWAVIGVDAELVNYSTINMLPHKDYQGGNDEISDGFKNALNLKAGVEFRLGPVSLRGGTAYYGSPYKNSYETGGLPMFDDAVSNKGTVSYSGGVGFRARSFYMDAAYSYMQHPKYYYDMYEVPEKMVSSVFQKTSNKVIITFGFRF